MLSDDFGGEGLAGEDMRSKERRASGCRGWWVRDKMLSFGEKGEGNKRMPWGKGRRSRKVTLYAAAGKGR